MADDRITGTRFDDVLGGTSAQDLIRGRGGSDLLRGRGNDDDLRGAAGADRLFGDAGDDRLFGGDGDDRLVGGRGDDALFGGAGDDLMIWNDGDGSDLLRGGAGEDAARVNARNARDDVFEISSSGAAVTAARTGEGAFALDIRGVETLRLSAAGGDDVLDASGLAAGRLRLIVDAGAGDDEVVGSQGDDVIRGLAGGDLLVGFRGDDRMLGGGGDDLFVWNNGDGSDLMHGGAGRDRVQVNGAAEAGNLFVVTEVETGVIFERTNLGPFRLDLRSIESLAVRGGEGADEIDAEALGADAISLELFGGGGEDRLLGGAGGDLLAGGADEDVVNGGAGDDRLVWNDGDGSDRMIGGDGEDVLEVNGAEAGDLFFVEDAAEGDGALFGRENLDLFELDVSGTELLEVNGGSGDDVLDAEALSSDRIDIVFEGGAGDDTFIGGRGDDRMVWNEGDGNDRFVGSRGADVDLIEVNAGNADENQTLSMRSNAGGIEVRRADGGDVFSIVATLADRMELTLGAGDDIVDGGQLGNGKIGLVVIDAGAGDDRLRGGDGRDELIGGAGDDVYRGGDKADVFVFGRGADVVEDFADGVDKLRVERGAGFEDVTVTQDGDDALIALAGGASLRLLNTEAADLGADDFLV